MNKKQSKTIVLNITLLLTLIISLIAAAKADSLWTIESVDSTGNIYGDISLALDAEGNPQISYPDYTNNCLKYAKLQSPTNHKPI